MPDFSEMMRRRPATQEFYFEWEGLQIFGAIDITDVPKELEIRFTSPHPAGEVALRLNAFGCKFTHPDGKVSERIRLVHGDVNPTQGDENYARIPIRGATQESSILVYNEYLVGPRGLTDVKQLESFTGDSGMLVERCENDILFRCNSWKPADRKAFVDMQGSITLLY